MSSSTYLNRTTSGVVRSGPGLLSGFSLTAGSDTATLILYDNTAGSGTIIAKVSAVANTTVSVQLPIPAAFGTGVYAALTGTGPSATVYTI